jgi:predicted amino acid dehydrogenase
MKGKIILAWRQEMYRIWGKIIAGVILLGTISCFAADMEFTNKIRSITTNIIESVSDIQKKVVAITDFTDLEGNVTTLGRFFLKK